MTSTFRRDLDPLDLEIIERAFEIIEDSIELATIERSEILRRELMDIVRARPVSDPDALRDILTTDMISRLVSASRLHAERGRQGLSPKECDLFES